MLKKDAAAARQAQANPLVGQYFHSIENGQVVWQGTVVSNPEPGWYLVQLFEFLSGEPNVRRLIRLEDMKEWLFYPDSHTWIESYERGIAREGGPYRKRHKE